MFQNLRRGRQARKFTTNVPKILDLKSSSEQIFFRKLSLGAPVEMEANAVQNLGSITSRCSGNEPALLSPQEWTERAAEIDPG